LSAAPPAPVSTGASSFNTSSSAAPPRATTAPAPVPPAQSSPPYHPEPLLTPIYTEVRRYYNWTPDLESTATVLCPVPSA
jgi:hypothetical protein